MLYILLIGFCARVLVKYEVAVLYSAPIFQVRSFKAYCYYHTEIQLILLVHLDDFDARKEKVHL